MNKRGNTTALPAGLRTRIDAYDNMKKNQLAVLATSDKPYADILTYVTDEAEQSRKMANFNHAITCFKSDGVYQLNKAISAIYGSAKGKGDDKPSGGEANLETVDVQLADGTRAKVPYGKIALPDLGDGANIDIAYDNSSNVLLVRGTCQFRYNTMIDEIVDLTKIYLNTESIYKDQALELDSNYQPKIMDLSGYEKEPAILSKKAMYDLNGLYARIRNPKDCVKKGIALKTGIMLAGPYGTGKTLLAFNVGWEAINKGWVFVYLKDPKLLAKTLRMCKTLDKNGNGVILFLEDVDQATTGERTDAMQDILNTLDGGDTKQMNVISMFSTNHLDKINPTFLRGKRIGKIVSLGAVDNDTALQFITRAFGDEYSIDLTDIDKAIKTIVDASIVPAFMAEIIESIKSNLIIKGTNTVTWEDLQFETESYMEQVKLSQKRDEGQTLPEKLSEALSETIFSSMLKKDLEEIKVACC